MPEQKKIGRPKVKSRRYGRGIAFTNEEWEKIVTLARASGLSIPSFILMCVLK